MKKVSTPKIKYIQGDESMLDDLKILWEGLNQHQLERSTYFKHHFREMTFQKRKADWLKKAGLGKMHVEIAVNKVSGQNVGYCVSSVTLEKTGEIKSIFVAESFRGIGIGDAFPFYLVKDK